MFILWDLSHRLTGVSAARFPERSVWVEAISSGIERISFRTAPIFFPFDSVKT